jgi:hypothetical protein
MRFIFYLAVSYSIVLGITSSNIKICQMFISIGPALGQPIRQVIWSGDMGDAHLTCLAPLWKSQNPLGA